MQYSIRDGMHETLSFATPVSTAALRKVLFPGIC
jgi:hypothetical protein